MTLELTKPAAAMTLPKPVRADWNIRLLLGEEYNNDDDDIGDDDEDVVDVVDDEGKGLVAFACSS
jgi:hypothetical protein